MARTSSTREKESALLRENDSPWIGNSINRAAHCVPTSVTDVHSTSTVTDTTASSDSERSSHDGAPSTPSPRTDRQPLSLRWPLDEHSADDGLRPATPGKTLSTHAATGRALPRCGVLNFCKEGDSLRWAPRVTRNCGGIAARVHNFEDAFSLEEFSSKALPIVWQSTGANFRMSSAHEHPGVKSSVTGTLKLTCERISDSEQSTSEKSLTERGFRYGRGSSNYMKRSSSFKRTVVVANEMRRPSFWSLLANSNKYSKSRAHRRLCGNEENDCLEQSTEFSSRGSRKSAWNALIRAFTGRNANGDHDYPRSAKTARKTFPFKRFVERSTSKMGENLSDELDVVCANDANRSTRSAGQRGGAIRMRRKPARVRQSEDNTKNEVVPGRRVRSSMGGHRRKERDGSASVISSQDDQYVTFITSVA